MARYRIIQYAENSWIVEKRSYLRLAGKLLLTVSTLGLYWASEAIFTGAWGFWSPWEFQAGRESYEDAYQALLDIKGTQNKPVVRYFD